MREGDWQVAPVPADLQDRRVEITGPAGDRKMVINAFNSGAKVYMADFEDANSPTWENVLGGQLNLTDAIERTISVETRREELRAEGRGRGAPRAATRLASHRAARRGGRRGPSRRACSTSASTSRGTRRACSSAEPGRTSTSRSSRATSRLGSGTTSSASPRTGSGIPRGTIKATVLIETILAAFEMEEILYELRDHSAGLNAGRWDYIFSVIKKFRDRDDFVLPDRAPGDDDRAVHARVHRAPRPLVPHARRARDRRHGGVHPEPAGRRGERDRAHEGSRGQAARVRRRLRRHVGRAPGSRPGRQGGLRRGARREAEPARAAARGRLHARPPTS